MTPDRPGDVAGTPPATAAEPAAAGTGSGTAGIGPGTVLADAATAGAPPGAGEVAAAAEPLATPPVPRRRRRRALVGVLLALLLAGALGGAFMGGYQIGVTQREIPVWDPLYLRALFDRPLDSGLPQPGPWMAGYYVHYDPTSLASLQARSQYLDQVVTFSYGVGPDGSLQGRDPDRLLGVIRPEKLVVLFANMVDDEFSTAAVRALLTDPVARRAAVRNITAKVAGLGAAGAQVDFEGVPPALRAEFTAFVQELARDLHGRNLQASLAVPAKTADNPTHGWSGAFDYDALGTAADYLYIMAYDEHYRNGPPGPVASLPWVDQVLRFATFHVPGKKIILGVPGYGYDWGGKSAARAYGHQRMHERMEELNAVVRWDAIMGENVATYDAPEGPRTVWFPDERSLDLKLKLARQYGIRGVALWRLGFESDGTWTLVHGYRSSAQP